MSTTSALENNEDIENVPLVRMEDVQPPRDRNNVFDHSPDSQSDEILETCIVDNDIDYDNECVLNDDDDSNIGSMVSIHSEEVVCCDESDSNNSAELIVPEVVHPPLKETPVVKIEIEEIEKSPKTLRGTPESWPTLEILPGGVIKHMLKPEDDLGSIESHRIESDMEVDKGQMVYACAKCSQRFKYLFCLVKHVKWHEDQKKKEEKSRLPYICLHSGQRKIMPKSKVIRKVPKKS